ncbi:MAG: V-type ATPase subunit [Bacilli bacterium]|nr:V-type ATPase subunit [Bacilli bacterium]
MSSFSANAILAKARSMYSKRLTTSNYEELLKRRSISDLVAYLKSDTAYSFILSKVKDNDIHRGQLESLLNEESFRRLSKLMRYASKKELEFYRLGILEEEIHLILLKVRLMASKYYSGYEMSIPEYLNRYASFNLYELLTINNYDALLELLYSTRYYATLKKFKPTNDERIDSNLLEKELKHIYYAEYINVVNKLFKGKKRQDLLTMIKTSLELQNITKMYRLKKYFHVSNEQIRNSLFLEYSRIPKNILDELIEAKSVEDFLKKLTSSPYKLYIDDQEFVYIEYYTDKIKYNIAKRFMRFSTDSALVFMTYKIVYQVEIDNLKHIIEGLRYGETASQIEAMLIY